LIYGDGYCNLLQSKASINRDLMEAVVLPTFINQIGKYIKKEKAQSLDLLGLDLGRHYGRCSTLCSDAAMTRSRTP
jgi:hypothetical protein